MNYETNEDTIDLKSMLFSALYQWKKWLLAAVIVALLLGGYKGMSSWSIATDKTAQDELKQTYEDALASYESTKAILQETIETGSKAMKDQEKYLKNSVLMRLDYRNVYVSTISLYVFTDYKIQPGMTYQDPDTTPLVVAAYETALKDDALIQNIAAQVNMETRFLQELITVSKPEETSGVLRVTVMHESGEKAAKITELLTARLNDVQQSVAQSVGPHTLKTAVSAAGATVSTTLATRQDTENKLFTQYKENVSKAKTELDELQKPVDTDISKTGAIKSFVKWGVVGFVAGAVLAVLVLCIVYALSDAMHSADSLESNTGVRCLGVLADENRKYGRLTRWLRRLAGHVSENAPGAEELIAARVAQYCKPNTTWLVSGEADNAQLDAQTRQLQELLPEQKFVCAGSLLRDAAAVRELSACDGVLLVEQCGRSTCASVRRELAEVSGAGKTVAGFIAIDR